ncbi:hypothetical protein M8C21_024868 [Ambrosia artemisiifolia]|uniref:Cellulose synthase-like protein G3 n=1 Tax=Ambrosia artemisiifolia TaxID=4212 RepID=A0AAD5GHU7_AMBAR|nr:hypothetical protein M8C21_024868 [Ambrosia artemisiifolia]
MEAAKFAKVWLPFCRDNNIMDRCPEAYFSSSSHGKVELHDEEIKVVYERMKIRIENVVDRGEICSEYIINKAQRQIFNKYRNPGFTRVNHPAIIQVLIESTKERDNTGQPMPNLVYVSREKSKNSPHHFKAGALNSLLRVSGVMTNAPIVLTQDCDMYSNDPQTLKRVLCYIYNSLAPPRLGYVQFPQRYHGLNNNDIYGGEVLRLFVANPVGMDGLQGPSYVGSGCFFLRRVFFGGPTSMVQPEVQELRPDHMMEKPITTEVVKELAHHVAGCNYENNTKWGYQLGFRYGSLVEDYFTGYQLHCEGWESIFCHPSRPAFLGDVPISLIDAVSQTKRWAIGLLEVTDPWFMLYAFLFVGAYYQDCYDFILFNSTYKRWWNDQRIWLIKGLSPYLFGLMEYIIKHLGITTLGFNVTSKVQDNEQSKRYDQGLMEFGIHSPMFIPFTTASIVNIFALVIGMIRLLNDWSLEKLFVQMFIAGFGVLNSWPVYEAMITRSDKGRMSVQTIVVSFSLAFVLCCGASLVL